MKAALLHVFAKRLVTALYRCINSGQVAFMEDQYVASELSI